jgi:hypothetical protein
VEPEKRPDATGRKQKADERIYPGWIIQHIDDQGENPQTALRVWTRASDLVRQDICMSMTTEGKLWRSELAINRGIKGGTDFS